MKPPINFFVSEGFKDAVPDSKRLQKTIIDISKGLSGGVTLTENLQTQLLTVPFSTPQSSNLSILTKFTTRPLWVELVSFSRTLPTYAALSLGTGFRWTWGDGYVTTDVFNGMPSDGSTYQAQFLVFLQ